MPVKTTDYRQLEIYHLSHSFVLDIYDLVKTSVIHQCCTGGKVVCRKFTKRTLNCVNFRAPSKINFATDYRACSTKGGGERSEHAIGLLTDGSPPFIDKFPELEENNLTSQLRRAATCMPLNIAEGSGSWSVKIFLNFLVYAYRSSRECEACLVLAKDLKYLTVEEYKQIFNKLDYLVRKLYRFMCSVEEQCNKVRQQRNYFYQQKKYEMEQDLKTKNETNNSSCVNNLS